MTKRIICILLCLTICLSFVGCAKKEKATASIYDSAGKVIVSSAQYASLSDKNSAYLDVVITEASDIIKKLNACDTETAKKQIKKYSIYTYLNQDMIKAMETAYSENISGADFGCSIVDLKGNIVAVYSASSEENKNFAVEKKQQHSTMKPLSVYAPAIEKGLINWSSLTEDSPYKQLTNSKGVLYDWPSNATGKYSYKKLTTYEALKESINTVAVKTLSDYGVNNSIEFLQKNFNLDLSYEQSKATMHGEDEIIGNIALGATMAGSTTVDMAGYYQIFANGGSYTEPKSISKIVDKNGKVVYERTAQSTQVISAETSCLMNFLLRGVLKSGGTGVDAQVNGVEVAGKTGTGDARSDNWFVGITPEFSCAVWHSKTDYKNQAATVFSTIVKNCEIKNTLFMTSPNVKKYIYCAESGLLLGNGCKSAEMGYYLTDNLPAYCNIH